MLQIFVASKFFVLVFTFIFTLISQANVEDIWSERLYKKNSWISVL